MANLPFSIPSSLNLRELLDCIDARMEALDLLEQEVRLHNEDLAVMGKRLEIQQRLLQQMLSELQRPLRGLHLLAAQDTVPAKKRTTKP